jgi:FkbM family methyltransferase
MPGTDTPTSASRLAARAVETGLQTRSRLRLKRLHRRALAAPRHQSGVVALDGYRVAYQDLLSLYMEYKDIFVRRIYDFEATGPAPRVLDGGAYIGMAALRFKHRHPAARVTSFEPDPVSRELLEANLARNGVSDVEVVGAALDTGSGEQGFRPDGSDGGRVVAPGDDAAFAVPTVPLVDYLDEPVDFLKLNIEGFELPVLTAAADRLRVVREMVIEYHGWARQPQRLGLLLELLDGAGFRYLVNDIDEETNPATRSPFSLSRDTDWFALVYARRADLVT